MKVINLAGVRLSAGYFNSTYAFTRRRTACLTCRKGWELICFDSDVKVSLAEGEYELSVGDVLCLRPNEEWRVSLPCRMYYVCMDHLPLAMEQLLEAFGRLPAERDSDQVRQYMMDISKAQCEGNVLQCTAHLLSLLSLLEKQNEVSVRVNEGGRTKTQEAIRLGLEYMREHYCEKCTLKEIASYAGRSPIYFHDIFSEVMGITPYEYIAQIRLEQAKNRLLMTDEDPADIAENIGFCSQSYFNFVFKKATGMTPLNFRRAASEAYLTDDEEQKTE